MVDDSTEAVEAHLVDEFGEYGSTAVEFLRTAKAFIDDGDSTRQPRLAEAVAFCVREALKRILDSVPEPGTTRLAEASRRVTQAKGEYERGREAAVGDEDAGLDRLLAAIDDMESATQQESIHQRRLIAVLASRTGDASLSVVRAVVEDYQTLIGRLNTAVHDEIDLDAAIAAYEQARSVLARLFLPPDERHAVLDELASLEHPDAESLGKLRAAVCAPSHLRYFFGHLVSPRWLSLLTDPEFIEPPHSNAVWPVFELVQNLATRAPEETGKWLDDAYTRWGSDARHAHYIARAGADLRGQGHEILLRALSEHPRDSAVCHTVAWAIKDVDPADPIVVAVADHVLNEDSGLSQVGDVDREYGILNQLVRGVTASNACDRIRLLCFKIVNSADDDLRRSLLFERGGSVADSPRPYDGHAAALTHGLTAAVERAFEFDVPVSEILSYFDPLVEELRGRLRAWALAAATTADAGLLVEEVASAIASRLPTGDDLILVDRAVAVAGASACTAPWQSALGDAPSGEEVAAGLAAGEIPASWRRARHWLGLLPDTCVGEWRSPLSVLVGAWGPADRSEYDTRELPEMGWARSPLSPEDIGRMDVLRAATQIRNWRPEHSMESPLALARSLQTAIEQEPGPWLASPLEVITALRHPVNITHYFRGIAKADIDLTPVAGALVECVAICRAHPWPPAVLSDDSFDFEPDWTGVDRAGVDVLQKLAASDAGFGDRGDQAWELVASAARDREASSFVGSPREDPLDTAINRPCTEALEAAMSLIGYEYRSEGTVKDDALALLDEALALGGWDGAEHRAIIAPRLPFLLHVAPTWVEANAERLFGSNAPDGLGQKTLDLAIKWGRPNRWLFERALDGILDAVSRDVKNASTMLLIAMLWGVDGYEPPILVKRLASLDTSLLSDAGETLGRLLRREDIELEFIEIGVAFWREVLARENGPELRGFGWWSEVTAVNRSTWEELTRRTAEFAGGKLDWAHKVAERAAKPPMSKDGLAILDALVRGAVDEWDRLEVMQIALDALRAASPLSGTVEFRRLRSALIDHGVFDAKEIQTSVDGNG